MSHLEEFPDGGRATLVRRYSPPLRRRQLDILRTCRYETPRSLTGSEYRTGRELTRLGLLEREPGTAVFRCTEAGTEVVQHWIAAGLIEVPHVEGLCPACKKQKLCPNCHGRGGGIDEEDVSWTCIPCGGTGKVLP
jgi:hypothetical protein